MIKIKPLDVILWTFRRNENDVVNLYNVLSPVMQLASGGNMLNFGYWDKSDASPIMAQNKLCDLVGNMAELDSAKSICKQIGIRHTMLSYDELQNPQFVANDKTRCYHCRTELSGHLLTLASELGISTIVDGTNTDDLGDYRPGIEAMRKNGIHSPLVECEFSKRDVRREAKKLSMNVWDRPSNSCLASRIPWGVQVTAERLIRIELAEKVVKNSTGARQVRVRDIDGAARIEVGAEDMEKILNFDTAKMLDEPLRMIGFTSVTVDHGGYVQGGANVVSD